MGWLKRRIIESMEPTEYELERRWIPVTERLPDEGERVLVFDKAFLQPEMGTYYSTDGWVGDEIASLDPSHWMPLPAPPTNAK
jgi:hypothetical protein